MTRRVGVATAAALACVLAWAGGARAQQAGEPVTLEALMEGMASAAGVKADFHEVKTLGLLAAPLESRGTLYFVPPDRLLRHTTHPGESRLVIDGDRLRFQDEAGDEDVDLGADPVARAFVDNLVVLFRGDLAELERRYQVSFTAEDDRWELSLAPRHVPVKDLIEAIVLRGEGRVLSEMEVRERDGDRTLTQLSAVETDRRFTPEELARLFGPDAAP